MTRKLMLFILCLILLSSLSYADYAGSGDSLNSMARKAVKCGITSGNSYGLGAELKNGVNVAFTFFDINNNKKVDSSDAIEVIQTGDNTGGDWEIYLVSYYPFTSVSGSHYDYNKSTKRKYLKAEAQKQAFLAVRKLKTGLPANC